MLRYSAMADVFWGFNKGSNSSDKSPSVRDEDFDEEDVWAVINETTDPTPKLRKPKDSSSSISAPRRVPTASRMIPRANSSINHEAKVLQQSAPVNIPDWSKIYRKNLKKASDSHGFGGFSVGDDDDDGGGIENVEDDDDRVPPHKWIAKKVARSQISSFSVCEGVGRTLKGRDLSNVRNAILTRTGFLE